MPLYPLTIELDLDLDCEDRFEVLDRLHAMASVLSDTDAEMDVTEAPQEVLELLAKERSSVTSEKLWCAKARAHLSVILAADYQRRGVLPDDLYDVAMRMITEG